MCSKPESPQVRKNLTNLIHSSESQEEATRNPNPGSPVDPLDIPSQPAGSARSTRSKTTFQCISGCNIRNDKNMIRCMHCMLRCHTKCVGEASGYSGVWACFECRLKPKQIASLVNDMKDALSQIRDLNHTIADLGVDTNNLKDAMQTINSELCQLRLLNVDLKKENSDLKTELAYLKKIETSVSSKTVSTPDLLIGSSVIRNIEATDQSQLLTTCISGIKFKAVTEKLADLESQQKSFKTIHVVTGSSDCNLSESTCESIKQNVKESIDQALKISENVQISSILPRTDDQEANIKAENTNLSLKDLCSEYDKVSFCDQDVNFRLADGSINDALLVNDGLHPNHKGSLRIINNLKLNARVKKFNRGSSTSWNYEPKQYNMTYSQ